MIDCRVIGHPSKFGIFFKKNFQIDSVLDQKMNGIEQFQEDSNRTRKIDIFDRSKDVYFGVLLVSIVRVANHDEFSALEII